VILLLARRLVLLLLFRSLTASPACESNALLACSALAIYIYIRILYISMLGTKISLRLFCLCIITESVVS
jgi:hypothetical protein